MFGRFIIQFSQLSPRIGSTIKRAQSTSPNSSVQDAVTNGNHDSSFLRNDTIRFTPTQIIGWFGTLFGSGLLYLHRDTSNKIETLEAKIEAKIATLESKLDQRIDSLDKDIKALAIQNHNDFTQLYRILIERLPLQQNDNNMNANVLLTSQPETIKPNVAKP